MRDYVMPIERFARDLLYWKDSERKVEIKMFEKWDEEVPVSSWKKIKSERIKINNTIE